MKRAIVLVISVLTLPVIAAAQGPATQTQVQQRLVAGFYAGEGSALAARNRMRQAESFFKQGVRALALVSRDVNGRTKIADVKGSGARELKIVQSAARLAGAPRGADYSAEAIADRDYLSGPSVGFSKAAVDDLKGRLQPNQSALMTVVDDRWGGETAQRMAETGLIVAVNLPLKPVQSF